MKTEEVLTPEAFQKYKASLMELLDIEGSALILADDHQAGVHPDFDKCNLTLGARVGPVTSVTGFTHEIGHLMVTREEAIGDKTWGMENPNVSECLGIIYRGEFVTTGTQATLEAKVWAWQWIIDEAIGLSSVSDRPPEHSEARFLEAWSHLGENDKERGDVLTLEIQHARAAIQERFPDPIAAVKERIARIPDYVAQRAAMLDAITEDGLVLRLCSRKDLKVVLRQYTATSGDPVYDVSLQNDDDGINVTTTKSLKRANRFFEIVAKNNELHPDGTQDPELVSPEMSRQPF